METISEMQNKVKQTFDKYLEALNKTKERRQLWINETKERIIKTLTLIEQTYKFDWHVQRLENVQNYQTINICCNTQNSGIIETTFDINSNKPLKTKAYKKYGGYLAYCQSYNGKINVIMGLPHVEEWVGEMNTRVITTIEPSNVTEEIILQHVIEFLQILTKWEGMEDMEDDGRARIERLPVGYKLAEQ